MNGRQKNKKWLRMGWILLFINIILIVAIISSAFFSTVNVAEIPQDKMPKLEDYISRADQKRMTYSEYSETPEYHEYEKALDEWYQSDEYVTANEQNERFSSAMRGVAIAAFIAIIITNWVAFFYILSQKADYIKNLQSAQNRNAVMNRLGYTAPPVQTMPAAPQQNITPVAPPLRQAPAVPVTPLATRPVEQTKQPVATTLDINTASEEQIAALPGLTVIDAKKAIAYRENNGTFKSTDDFFEYLKLKPHIIVRLQPLLTVNQATATPTATPAAADKTAKRRIDL